ncbi:MAG: hypothetical protein KDM91_00815 [Verrucomicrobiae bacterium]|nr:hypothetical protein [Verrucomicrobiae bacterium]
MLKVFLAALIGGFVAFAWTSFSWMALPLHESTLHQFSNESAVAEAIKAGAPETGVYIIPGDKSKTMEQREEQALKGPFVFAAVRPGANPRADMSHAIARGLLTHLVSGVLMAILLAAVAPRLNYAGRVGFVLIVAVLVCLLGMYPQQIWWEVSADFILWDMVDVIAGWGIASLIMAGMINGRSAAA